MKLFVWNNPVPVRNGSSMLYAVASNQDEARAIAAKAAVYEYGYYVRGSEGANANVELGEPTRVHELPCAEWFKWSD